MRGGLRLSTARPGGYFDGLRAVLRRSKIAMYFLYQKAIKNAPAWREGQIMASLLELKDEEKKERE